MMSTSTTVARPTASSVWKTGFLAGCMAAAANVLLYWVTKGIGVTFLAYIGVDGQAAVIPVGMVIAASLIGAVAGTAVSLVFARWQARGLRLFKIVGGLFLLASLGGPLNAGADGATQATLILMHVIAGTVIIASLSRGVWTSMNLR